MDDLTVHAQTPTGEPTADDTLQTHHAALERPEERHRQELREEHLRLRRARVVRQAVRPGRGFWRRCPGTF